MLHAPNTDDRAIAEAILALAREAATQPACRYFSVKQAAEYLGRTEKAIRHLVEDRKIPHIRIGRRIQFDRDALDRWMQRHAKRGAHVV